AVAPAPRTHHALLAVHYLSGGDHQTTALDWHSGNAVDGDLVMAGGAFLHAERIAAPGALEFPLLTRSRSARGSVLGDRNSNRDERYAHGKNDGDDSEKLNSQGCHLRLVQSDETHNKGKRYGMSRINRAVSGRARYGWRARRARNRPPAKR